MRPKIARGKGPKGVETSGGREGAKIGRDQGESWGVLGTQNRASAGWGKGESRGVGTG